MKAEKFKLYQEYIQCVTDSMALAEGGNKKVTPKIKALGRKVQVIGLKLMTVAPDEVVLGYIRWRAVAKGDSNAEAVFKSFCNLLIMMRKDLVGDTERNINDVLDILS